MTIDELIQAVLASLASGGAHQDIAPQGVVAPYIVWQFISSSTNNSLTGASDVQNARLQVDAYSRTQATRKSLTDAIVLAMATASFTSISLSTENLFEADTQLFRTTLDFSVWS